MVELHGESRVSLENVVRYGVQKSATIDVPGVGVITGDIAWGGNWFYLVRAHQQRIGRENIPNLVQYTRRIRAALDTSTLRGANGSLIDHIEICGPPSDPQRADSRNFVLCPGNEYDRSPCGTGTSAHVACLIEDGELQPGQLWRQESITGSVFEARGREADAGIVPTICGEAYVTARATLLFDARDPLVSRL